MRSFLILGLAVVGFQFGCGLDDTDRGLEPEVDSQEQRIICLTESFVTYYSDAAHTTVVGTERCYCGSTPDRTGRRTPFFVEESLGECP